MPRLPRPVPPRPARGLRRGRTAALAAAIAGLALLAGACSDDGSDAAEPGEVITEASGDLVSDAVLRQGPVSVLSAELVVETSEPTTVSVSVEGPSGETAVPSPEGEASTEHAVPVVGVRAETSYDVVVTATTAGGEEETTTLEWTTAPLPEDLPPVDVTVSEPDEMAPGVTIFNARYWGPPFDIQTESPPEDPDAPERRGFVLGVDEEGEVVWYHRADEEITDVSVTPEGTLMLSVHDVAIREIDVLGRTILEWGTRVAVDVPNIDDGEPTLDGAAQVVELDSAHHELYRRENGNVITIDTEVIDLDPAEADGLCDGVTDDDDQPVPDPEAIVSDVVVELDPDGEVVNRWPLTDYYDPIERPGSDMCRIPIPFAPPNWFYPDRQELRDWTHANAAVVDDATNTLLVSVRHLDSVLGIRYEADESGPAGELLWDMSPDGTLDMVPGGEFALHGHAVEPQADGTILYYDNGNGREGTVTAGGDDPAYSRAVQYRIDASAGTVEQLWEHRDETPGGRPVFAGLLSDADRLPNGDVLITHGGMSTEDNVFHSRIVEVVPASGDGEDRVVFDLTLGDLTSIGWTAYRAERVGSLYDLAAG